MLDQIRRFFIQGSVLSRLIGLNVLVFLVISLFRVLFFLFDVPSVSQWVSQWFGLSSNIHVIFHRPWSILTYMFLHTELLHLFFNMIVLYVGGRLFSDFIGSYRLMSIYLIGGLIGGLIYVMAFNVFPVFGSVKNLAVAIGASASVLAVFISVAAFMPDYRLPLFLLGPVRLKYIALFFVIMDIISIDQGNPGGHLAHLGGALWGFYYGRMLHRGKDMVRLPNAWIRAFFSLFSRKSTMRVEYHRDRPLTDDEYNDKRAEERETIDKILEKISKSGYDSLSSKEKQILFRRSKED